MWCAIANTEHGKCPGKAKEGTCWFSYGGKEYQTNDFKLVKSRKYSTECKGKPQAKQDDGTDLWCAVANTPHGHIPGKAHGDTCWYPYGGKEYTTHDFKWVVSKKNLEANDDNTSSSSSSDSD